MAELSIKITTKYEQAEKGFNRVTGSLKKYGDELIKARKEGTATRANVEDYINALNKALATEDRTKEGMAALTAQSKILGKEIAKMGLAFGDDVGLVKQLEGTLKTVKNDMQAMPQATRKAAAGMKEVDKASGGASNKLLSVAKNILKFQLLMGPITAVIRGFKDTLRDSVNLAAEAEQRFNKLATVFDGMSDSARRMAEEVASSLGVANSTAASAFSTVGDLLQAQGMGTMESLLTSADWIKQFQDIIAFKDINMSLEEFAQNFMSGAAGNLRNFRTFGSIVKESAVNARLAADGYDKLTGSELELAKMTTRATIALEQQKNAMGATEREWDTMLSINRRYEEQSKKLKENIGDMLNDIVKPMKEVWTEILETINKAIDAKKKFQRGEKTDYNMSNDSDRQLFTQQAYTLVGSFSNSYIGNGMGLMNSTLSVEQGFLTKTINETDEALDAFNRILAFYNADVAYLQDLLGNKLSDSFYEQLKALEAERNALWEETQARKAAEEALFNETETLSGNLDNFLEALMGIKGVGTGLSAGELMLGSDSFENQIKQAISQASEDALNNIRSTNLKGFVSAIDLALGEVDETDMLKGKANSLRTLYTPLFNQFTKDKTLQQNAGILKSVLYQYQQTLAEEQRIIAGREKATAFASGLSSLSSSSASYGRQMELIGLSEFDTQIKELTFAFEDMKAQFSGFTSDELKELGIDLTKLDEEFGKQITAYTDLYNAQQAYAATLAAQSNVSGFVTGAQDRLAKNAFVEGWTGHNVSFYNGSITTLNKAQAGALYDYRQNWNSIKASLGTMTTNEAGQYDLGNGLLMTFDEIDHVMQDDLMQSFKDLADAVDEVTSEFWKQYNPFQGTVDAYNSGKKELGGVSGGIWGILLELVKNTEAFQSLSSLVQDTIVPIMNAVLKPLLPALEAVRTLFDVLPWEIITFGIKVISSTLVLILHPIKMIFAIVHNIFEWLKHPVNKGARDIISLNAIADETNALLDKIWKTTTDIERNTDKDNLALLRDLYSRGIINEDQFYAGARVVQKDMVFDPVQATNPNYIASNSPASRAISYGGFTFYITGNDPEETARATIRALREAGVDLPYNTAIGRA